MNLLELTGQSQTHLVEFAPNRLLHKQVIADFTGLQNSAKNAGFTLHIASAFRSFERQLQIWNNKYSGITAILDKQEKPIDIKSVDELDKLYHLLHWSALPGASRHHWGTDIDVYDPSLLPQGQSLQLKKNEYLNGGYFSELTDWLSENMQKFGFYRPYQKDQGGVAEEPWHLSYFPISETCLVQLDLDLIRDTIQSHDILGKTLIQQELVNIYQQYVCNLTPR
ncbi:M15 family metallopeptidase [Psychromonas sp. 14N.309.X.WAT.B.A12]|uniref:M15 family metallopeptidase n=2 Tax=Psychromonas TaxID=67572 RepID=UPI0025B14F0C|nr:M15 family metallopeptidase [Psychromonas sp. 14N.309.X.WAT.B.A12]MDN2661931.1 M15 family metallopeptidase [Psychromonas sp. 14N.309.X.WAT.B.A12]